jgi:GntR family transcriptional regulator/MocR family aminotransferase
VDLLLNLRPDLGRQAAVEHAVREAIVEGQLGPGMPLPSSRVLATELGVARGTVVAAIDELAAEGLLETRPGSATRVAHVPPTVGDVGDAVDAADDPRPDQKSAPAPTPAADFWSGDPDLTLFPRSSWSAAVRNALDAVEAGVLGYGDPRGTLDLRVSVADYIARTRGVVVSPERTLITAGYSQTLAVVGRMLAELDGRPAAVEDPSFWRHRELLTAAGLDPVGVTVDADGVRTGELAGTGAGAAFVTPGHHTPLGVSLSPSRRAALVTWAAADDAVVVEDDYDGELRYDRRPLRAVQALDPARVVYCGTVSKSLAPGLRLSWCVLPPQLVEPAIRALGTIGGPSVSAIEQLALAELLRSGRYDRQVRRIRGEYHRRRDMLVTAIEQQVPAVSVEGVDAGLKALLRLPPGTDERAVVDRLTERSVAVAPLSAFQIDGSASPAGPAIVVNYGRPYGHLYRSALDRLVSGLAAILTPSG